MYPIQIVQYPAPPAKMQKNNFMSKIPKKHQKPYEIHVSNLDWICFWTVRKNLLSTPHANMQKTIVSKLPKTHPKPCEIHVPQFRLDLFWDFSEGNLLSTMGAPPAKKCEKAIS